MNLFVVLFFLSRSKTCKQTLISVVRCNDENNLLSIDQLQLFMNKMMDTKTAKHSLMEKVKISVVVIIQVAVFIKSKTGGSKTVICYHER